MPGLPPHCLPDPIEELFGPDSSDEREPAPEGKPGLKRPRRKTGDSDEEDELAIIEVGEETNGPEVGEDSSEEFEPVVARGAALGTKEIQDWVKAQGEDQVLGVLIKQLKGGGAGR